MGVLNLHQKNNYISKKDAYMKHLIISISLVSIIVVIFSITFISKHRTERVLIVYENQYKLIGKIGFSLDGELFYAWVVENIVIFRVDRKIGDEIGKKGKIYRIVRFDKLKEIVNADLSKTDYELA